MKMLAYLAAPYSARDGLRDYARELAAVGIECTSTWLDEQAEIGSGTVGPATDIDDDTARKHVRADFRDIQRSHILVAFTEAAARPIMTGAASSGGRHIETGYALAHGKTVVIVGAAENIFHRACTLVPDWHEALIELVRVREQWRREQPQGDPS